MQHEKIAHRYQHGEKQQTQYHMRHMQKLLLNTITTQVIWAGRAALTSVYPGRLMHRVMCLYTPQLILVLVLPTPNGWPGLVNLDG